MSHLYSILWLFLTSAVEETAFSEITFFSNVLKDKNSIMKYIPLSFLPLQKVVQPLRNYVKGKEEMLLIYQLFPSYPLEKKNLHPQMSVYSFA